MKKVILGAVGGGALWLLALIAAFFQGDPVGDVLGAFPAAIIAGIALTLWLTRNMDDEGNEVHPSQDDQIFKLQRQLESAVNNTTYAESRNDLGAAAHFRSQVALIESKLRRLGA